MTKTDAPKDVKKIILYQKDGVKVNITSEDCNIEEGMADGELGDDDEDAARSDTIFDSKIKQKLKQQALSNFNHVREAASRIQEYVSTESSQKESQSPQTSAMEVEADSDDSDEGSQDEEPGRVAKMEHTSDDAVD